MTDKQRIKVLESAVAELQMKVLSGESARNLHAPVEQAMHSTRMAWCELAASMCSLQRAPQGAQGHERPLNESKD